MLKRAGPSLDVAAIAFLAPDLASSLVHVAYLGERLGRCQRPPVFLTSKLTPHAVLCPASSLAWTRGDRTQPEPLVGVYKLVARSRTYYRACSIS